MTVALCAAVFHVEASDIASDFMNPPPGYGEVPFWWWSGRDPLDRSRLGEQLEELHKAGIAGVQVNYAHIRTRNRPTQDSSPAVFTDEWWETFSAVARECAKRGMGVSLSNYTLDFPDAENLWRKLGICTPDHRAWELSMRTSSSRGGGVPAAGNDVVAVLAAPVVGKKADSSGVRVIDHTNGGSLPRGDWRIYSFHRKQQEKTYDPLQPNSGRRVVERFFDPFIEKVPEEARSALNYFFQDELILTRDILWLWSDDLPEEFKKRKGYDLITQLPALFGDWGEDTAKVRLDMNDVMSALACERYYKPIYDWHASRGLIYGCDQATRGRHPMSKYIDYMRCMSYFTAPGFDTPGRAADIIKNKVGSSIAHLHNRPRVWLEGYHSQGWQASTSTIFDSTVHNYLYGSNLLNLHGLYYSTYGGWWEWAPPCYHFRMPYWPCMKTFLRYFERLSYVLSQGVHVADVAVVNPLEPVVYNRNRGMASVNASHDIVTRLVTEMQTDVDFIDADSIARATVNDGRLCAAGEAYRMVILPNMFAIRISTLEKLAELKKSGGIVAIVGEAPKFTDAFHSDKAKVDALISALASEKRDILPLKPSAAELKSLVDRLSPADFRAPGAAKALHRRVGKHDVYFVCDLKETGVCTFRAQGRPELWNPWDGTKEPLDNFTVNADGTMGVRIPADGSPRLVVFTAGPIPETKRNEAVAAKLPSMPIEGEWYFTLKPTLDNKWGDYRLPIRDRFIGAEIRRVAMKGAGELNLPAAMTTSFGPQFREFGPYDARMDVSDLERELAAQSPAGFAPGVLAPVRWLPFCFSWKEGTENRPAFQDWHHGLNGIIGDDFFVLGRYDMRLYDVSPRRGEKPKVHLYQTTVYAPCDLKAKPVVHGVAPQKVWIDGVERNVGEEVSLSAGYHTLLVRYESFGRAALVMMRTDVKSVPSKTPLSMCWMDDPAVLPFDCFGGALKEGVYTATLPPACKVVKMRVRGELSAATIDGEKAKVVLSETCATGDKVYLVEPREVKPKVVELSLRIRHEPGRIGGAAFVEPMSLTCGTGRISLGNWATHDEGIRCYSGGAVYEKTFELTQEQASSKCVLDLGRVGACCAVSLNGRSERVVCCPPWRVDLGGDVKEGVNTLKITVYNTLNNHYQTIPTRYKTTVDAEPSGLLGPVKVDFTPTTN